MDKMRTRKVGIGGLILAALFLLWIGMAMAASSNNSSGGKYKSPSLKIKEFREVPPK